MDPLARNGTAGVTTPETDEVKGLRRFSHEAMATVFEVFTGYPDGGYAAQAAQAAFEIVDRLEQQLSRFVPNSDIARINGLTAGESTTISPSTFECLIIARHLYDLTGGAFDVSIGTGYPKLHLEAGLCAVRAVEGGARLDLGGIGKGYAVDLMAEALEEWGVGSALVHGGFSSLLALEAPDGRDGWPITLSAPGAPSSVLARLSVSQTAVGASGSVKGGHVVDPRTGEPARNRLAVWAAVPRPHLVSGKPSAGQEEPHAAAAAVTDALTTAFMLLRPDEIEDVCRSNPGLQAWVLPAPAGEASPREGLLRFGGPPSE